MLYHITGKRYGQVVTQSFLTQTSRQFVRVRLAQFFRRYSGKKIAGVQYFEKQFVSLLAVFAHQRGEVLHGRRLDLLETIQSVNASDGVEYIIAFRHLHGRKITCTFRYSGFRSHILYPFYDSCAKLHFFFIQLVIRLGDNTPEYSLHPFLFLTLHEIKSIQAYEVFSKIRPGKNRAT